MKPFLFLFAVTLSAFALELTLKQDTNISVSPRDVEWTISNFLIKKMNIEKDDAKRITEDNRRLANEYLKHHALPEDLKTSILISLEEKLATLYVQSLQEKEPITDTIIESYYKLNQKEFTKEAEFKTTIYSFETFDDALNFYTKTKETPKKSIIIARDSNVTLFDKSASLSSFHPQITQMFKDGKSTDYLTPPFLFMNNFLIVYVENVTPSTLLTLQESKEKIKKILLDKTFRDKKVAIINSLKDTPDEK